MRTRNLLIPAFLLFLLVVSRIVWTDVDVEVAAYKQQEVSYGLLSSKYIQLAVFAAMLPFLLAVRRPIQTIGIFPPILFAIAAASVAWTYDIGATLYLLIPLACILGYAMAMNAMWGPGRALVLIWAFASLVILVSIPLAAIGDPHALMGGNHDGAWRGLFGHKNAFGPFLVIHMFLTLFGRRYMRLPLVIAVVIAAADVCALVFARSSTSLVAAVAGLAAGMFFIPIRHSGLRFLWRAGAVLVLVVTVSVALLDLDQIYALFGKDSSLAGRAQMWAQVYDMTFRNSVGTGYGTGGGTQVSIELQKLTKRDDSLGVQSGYLNMALELGWIAVGIFVFWLVSSMATALFASRQSSAQPLFVALAVEHLIGSYSESYGCLYPSWSLAVLVTALIAMRVHSPVSWRPMRRRPRVSAPAPA